VTLPWVRMDSNLPSHDKVLELLSDPSPKRWQAAASYVFSICWCGAAGTDGRITPAALPMVHGTTATARLLVKHGLWDETEPRGWCVRNYEVRQELALVTEGKRAAQQRAARRTNCIRYHGPNCGCWRKGDVA
jgi:hypothetical protein